MLENKKMQNNKTEKNSTAYIDASNLRFGVKQSGWILDYKSFRSWLRDKFGVNRAILFMGLIPNNFELYNYLQSIGYDISFRPTIINKDGRIKGNVDGELILKNEKAPRYAVTYQGSFSCL